MAGARKASPPELADLLGPLYEATAHPDLWPSALDAIGDALDGAALVSGLHRPDGMAFAATHRLDPDADKVLRAHYSRPDTNPLFAAMPRLPVLEPVAREAVMDDQSYLRCDLFNDIFRAQGFVHAGLSCLARENGVLIPCGVLRRENREFDARCFQLYGALLPHLRRALELTVRFSDLNATRHHVEAAANAGRDGLVVTDASGRVLYANRLAEAVFTASDGLSCRGGIMTTSRPDETARLHRLISAAALRFDYLGGDMQVSRAAEAMPWALVVMPGPEALSGISGTGSATALVRIIDLEQLAVAPESRLMEFFGLSGAEARIAAGLMEGARPEDIAERQSLRISTVRTHIRSIYLKTGTSRQAELVRLLLNAAGPPRSN